jgi:hypothetical protein
MLSAHQKKMGKKKQIFKIKLAQSFRYAHRYRLCVYMFIRMSDHMFMSICVCTVFLKCIVAPPGPVSSDEGPLRDVYCTRPTIHWAQACSIQVCKDFQAVAARTQPRQIPAHELFGGGLARLVRRRLVSN